MTNLGEEEGLEAFKASDKIALIDCDTVVFAACTVKEYADDLLPRDMYSADEWEVHTSHPGYDIEGNCIWMYDEQEVLDLCVERISEIQYRTNTSSAELHFTEGRNFRYDVYDMYKANRKGNRYPQGQSVIKRRLLEMYDGGIWDNVEADDVVVYKKRTEPEKYVLCAVDKDVYLSVPGLHFNYYRAERYNIDMKWVETEHKDAYQFPYVQTLMGDSTDNITGCPGIGKVKAAKAMEGLVTPQDMWRKVVDMFKSGKKPLTIKEAIRDMRLVNMHQAIPDGKGGYKVQLWVPPCDIK